MYDFTELLTLTETGEDSWSSRLLRSLLLIIL